MLWKKDAKRGDVFVPVDGLVLLVKEAVSGAKSRAEWKRFAVGDTAAAGYELSENSSLKKRKIVGTF